MSDPQVINVRYVVDAATRKVFSKALESIDPRAAPGLPSFPGVYYVPQKGDLLQWEEIGSEHTFEVMDRVFRFGHAGDQSLEITLVIGVRQR